LSAASRNPYGTGWTIRIRLPDPAEKSRLIDSCAYQKLAEETAAKRKPKAEP